MIKVANCSCSLDEALSIPYGIASDDTTLRAIVAKALGVKANDVVSAEVIRRSVDARKKLNVHIVLTLAVVLRNEKLEHTLIDKGRAQSCRPYEPLTVSPVPNVMPAYPIVSDFHDAPESFTHLVADAAFSQPIVVGLGPAGLFAALYLARAGLRPLVVERGANVRERQRVVEAFNQGGALDPCTNIQFGEGGAGTFSDGKLTTGTKHPFAADVLHWFVEAGAPQDILWDAKPHIGSDVLPDVVEHMRNQIEEAGGRVLFKTRLADVEFEAGRLRSVVLETPEGSLRTVFASALVLACGHSARDTFEMLHRHGLAMERKPFSMGVRIEHEQSAIDVAQYGDSAGHPALGPAEYKMAVHVDERRSAYTFCMCPGGQVVCAASEEGGICTNGMSNRARDGENANAALLVNVDPADFGGDGPLAGMYLQRDVERQAFQVAQAAGGLPYQAPCQTVGGFLGKGHDADAVLPTYARGTVSCDLRDVLPAFVCETLAQALPMFDRKLRGFASSDAVMTAPEARSSSPVRIVRTKGYQAILAAGGASDAMSALDDGEGCGIYPCGEGPGYAGGIMSAAADGMRVAAQVTEDLRKQLLMRSFHAAVDALQEGQAAVFPTDTVAGLGVSVLHAGSPDEIFRIKRRTPDKPVAWLVDGSQALREFGCDLPEGVEALAQAHWPGPLTIIVKAGKRVPDAFQSESGTIGMRMPDNETALRLIEAVGGPVATSSANVSGQDAPDVPQHVSAEVREAAGAILEDETHPSGQASTVLDCSGATPRILREGAVTKAEIHAFMS